MLENDESIVSMINLQGVLPLSSSPNPFSLNFGGTPMDLQLIDLAAEFSISNFS